MPFVKCGVGGCNTRLQPLLKPDPRERDTWVYPECDVCFRPVCEEHSAVVGGRVVCDRCRREEKPPPGLIQLGIPAPAERR